MIRGVVFDLDHTLFDRYATIRSTFPDLYAHFRDKIPEELSAEEFIERLIPIEKKYIHHGWYKVLEVCVEEGILAPLTAEEQKETVRYIVDHCWAITSVPYGFAAPTLKRLREEGYKLGIVTNGGHDSQAQKIEKLKLAPLVDEIVISGDVGVHKPAAEPFLAMCEKLRLQPEELVYVGDHPRNDVEGSRKVGYIPIWVNTTGYWSFDDIPRADYEVDTVEQLPDLLKKMK